MNPIHTSGQKRHAESTPGGDAVIDLVKSEVEHYLEPIFPSWDLTVDYEVANCQINRDVIEVIASRSVKDATGRVVARCSISKKFLRYMLESQASDMRRLVIGTLQPEMDKSEREAQTREKSLT